MSILAICGHKEGVVLHSRIELGMFFFQKMRSSINKSPSSGQLCQPQLSLIGYQIFGQVINRGPHNAPNFSGSISRARCTRSYHCTRTAARNPAITVLVRSTEVGTLHICDGQRIPSLLFQSRCWQAVHFL